MQLCFLLKLSFGTAAWPCWLYYPWHLNFDFFGFWSLRPLPFLPHNTTTAAQTWVFAVLVCLKSHDVKWHKRPWFARDASSSFFASDAVPNGQFAADDMYSIHSPWAESLGSGSRTNSYLFVPSVSAVEVKVQMFFSWSALSADCICRRLAQRVVARAKLHDAVKFVKQTKGIRTRKNWRVISFLVRSQRSCSLLDMKSIWARVLKHDT